MLVLTGAPPAFCAGADLTGVEGGEFVAALVAALRGFTELGIATIAAVDGPALGAGTQLAIACDLRVATPSSVFGIPAAKLGLVVDHWTVDRMAREFGCAGRSGDAAGRGDIRRRAAPRAGAVHRLGDLDDALAWARRARRAGAADDGRPQAGARAVGPAAGADELFEAARAAAWASADAREGRTAFLEKRPARLHGILTGSPSRRCGGAAGTVNDNVEPPSALLGPDPPAVLLDDRRADRQPEPGAALLAGVRGVDLVEAVEDPLQLVGRDAAAVVARR